MPWTIWLLHLLCGALLVNGIPHLVHGLSGEPFQSPFAKPSGVGLSSPIVNVLWGFFNLFAAIALLLWRPLDTTSLIDLGATALGALLIGLFTAQHFGRVKGNT